MSNGSEWEQNTQALTSNGARLSSYSRYALFKEVRY
jgi:hypothetical protein